MGDLLLLMRSQLLREGMSRMLSDADFSVIDGIATADDVFRLKEIYPGRQIGLVVMEAVIWQKNPNIVSDIRNILPGARVSILANSENIIKLGHENIMMVDGIISSEVSIETVIQSIRLISLGERMVPVDFLPLLLGSAQTRVTMNRRSIAAGGRIEFTFAEDQPSPREIDVLRWLVDGAPNKIIARELGITEATVKVHLKGLLRKIRVTNRTQAAIWALQNGVVGALAFEKSQKTSGCSTGNE